ncbi:Peptidoglycan/LPS O-acetylase OafA/YrhL, contains acyltransferase and SGNH-hydrolase domains [Dysgonomonas macrotermitis]|uniref:Peptidoglycan/LPS O-acetylase OafA/YrhL, contains acyltransferase and SGNH-hydrolase domains n=2 Tax=Dysgonomonas macrotermitis TaxID=1346286 RepID=A0A1M5BFW8_9BACT|nr:Peptidoglycan/LPS O-acetylase OafA/YrhL, contains acyltransferase and SGNH-hydrolase domains [Dysgonomonas macrotermitis]
MYLDLTLISKYRTQLMGFAMLWIVIYHMPLVFYVPLISEIKWMGFSGVDIFFLVSGLGIYFSWTKNPSTKDFLKKRLLRIFSLYIPISLVIQIYLIYSLHYPVNSIFYVLTTVDFWFPKGNEYYTPWFIPAICLMYFITPIFLKITSNKTMFRNVCLACISIIILSILFPNFLTEAITRFPNYFLGIYIGFLIKQKVRLSKIQSIAICGALMLGILCIGIAINSSQIGSLLDGRFIRYCLIFTTFPLTLIISQLLNLLSSYKYPFLSFLGLYSLPIYLTNERIYLILESSLHISKTILCILALAITLGVSYLIQNWIYKYIDKWSSQTKEPT